MSRSDIDGLYEDYADWQSRTAHSKSGMMVKRMMSAIGIAKKNILDDMEEVIDHFREQCGFKDRAETLAYLGRPIDHMTRSTLRRSILRIEDQAKRRKLLNRIDSLPVAKDILTNRKALYMIVENTITDIANRIDGVMIDGLTSVMTSVTVYSMYTLQKGCRVGWSFSMPNKRQIAVLMKGVYDRTFADNFAGQYVASTKEILVGGVTSGSSVRAIASQIEQSTGQELWRAKRLVRTEITRAGNVAESYALTSAGIDKYEFSCTLDERTCEVCGAMDGRIFRLDDASIGVNYPPMHPNCRCWHHAALTKEVKERMTRVHRNQETGKSEYIPMSITYDQWKTQYLNKV